MPTALGVLVLAATLSSVPTYSPEAPPPAVLKTRDGATIEIAAPRSSAARRVIVEFAQPPLLARRKETIATASASESYRETFERFRTDVANLRHGKSESSMAIGQEYFVAFHGMSATLDAASLEAVRRFPYVKAIHEDSIVKAFATEDTTRMTRTGVDRVWSQLGAEGNGIVVAVIDSGVDYTHPSLGGGIGPNFKVIFGFDFVTGDLDPMDEHGHGTHVAGIIAGDGTDVRGVAPHAKLLAYRVLDKYGQGSTSNILGAIEWTVDPDRDGDPSDHADVANMSLGGGGDADSPLSLAVDQATRAGVVFALAAGNTPGERSVGAPGASRLGITVGASDNENLLAGFSSRGPISPDWLLKPEIVAPGVLIRSANMGGGTVAMSGTSMAAPHVAGAAALLLELHPDWTPAEVKAALVGTAKPIEEHVMGQGGGLMDVHAAATSGGASAPAVVTFGRHGGKDAWTAARIVRIANRSTTEQTFTASFTTPQGVVIAAEPSQFTLAAGASQDVTLNASFSADAGAALQYLAHGGRVTFTSAGDAVQVPWVAIDAARVVVTHQLLSTVLWNCDSGPGMSLPDTSYEHELLMPNSRCDLLVYSMTADDAGPSFIMRTRTIDGDSAIALTAQDAMHEVRLGGLDQNGQPISSVGYSPATPYVSHYELRFPPSSKFTGLSLSTFSSEPLRTSDLDDGYKLTISEMLFDFPNRSIYAIHHPQLRGVHGSTTLSSLPSDLRHARVSIAPQAPGTSLHGLMMYSSDGLLFGGGMNPSADVKDGWSGDVYITPETVPDTWGGVALLTSRQAEQVWDDFHTAAFRAFGDEIAVSNDIVPSPAAYRVPAGGTIALGQTPLHPGSFVERRDTAFRVSPLLSGPALEQAVDASTGFTFEIRDGSGTLLRQGTSSGALVDDFGGLGPYRVSTRSKSGVQLALAFDTSREDFNPPSLSSLRVTGGDGRIVSRVLPGTAATLAFSVADMNIDGSNIARDSGELRNTRVSWRVADGEWQELAIAKSGEDRGEPVQLGHFETGVHYRADLAALGAVGEIDLRFELEDASGNTSASVIEDVLTVGGRRRTAGH